MSDSYSEDNVVCQALPFVFAKLGKVDLAACACVCKGWMAVAYEPALWQTLDLRGMPPPRATALLRRLSQPPPHMACVTEINLEFQKWVEDRHLSELLRGQPYLTAVNLNACQSVTDEGIRLLAESPCGPNLTSLSLYWNLNVTNLSIFRIAASCPNLTTLNVSGCKNVTDGAITKLASSCPKLTSLNLTRCVLLTDDALISVCLSCPALEQLWLYALYRFSGKAYDCISVLKNLKLLDVCGSQTVTDAQLASIAKCSQLTSLNLTWCVHITDKGLLELAKGCRHLELLSLHGILGVTDAGIDALAQSCAATLHTLDVNGCTGIKDRNRQALLGKFPNLKEFLVHR
eukprot:jgi/Mesvir1/7910/Mv25065-RA.1